MWLKLWWKYKHWFKFPVSFRWQHPTRRFNISYRDVQYKIKYNTNLSLEWEPALEIEFWFGGITIGFYPKHPASFIYWETICYMDFFKVDLRKAVEDNFWTHGSENESINAYNLKFLTNKANKLWD